MVGTLSLVIRSTCLTFFVLGSRHDSRRNSRALENLLRGGGSLIGLAGSSWANSEGGGNPGQGEAEDGSNCEAAVYGEGEEEDLPPPYAQVVGAGAVLDSLGEGTFV